MIALKFSRSGNQNHHETGNEPIDEDKLEVLLRAKEREKQEAMHIEDTHTGRLVTEEIEMLQVVLHFVMRKRQDYSFSSSIR